ncbi:MAG: hypothetical protein ACE5L7_03360 [Candidatus Aminicenantales bacterium]
MNIFGKRFENKVFMFQDEREFYNLIEQRLREQGYQLIDTLKKINRNNSLGSPRLNHYR